MRSYGRAGWMACMVVVCVSALVIGRNAQLQAQNSNKTYATTEEAIKVFMNLLNKSEENSVFYFLPNDDWRSAGVFSAQDQGEFSRNDIRYMFGRLRAYWRQGGLHLHPWEVEEVAMGSGTKIIRLKQGMPITLEIVAIRESDSWRVSLRKTYARWFNLKSDAEFSKHVQELKLKSCQSNLKQISLATLQYVQDYDEKYPPVKDWQGLLSPYVQSEFIFHCPLLPDEPKGVGYAYNWKLYSKHWNTIESSPTMIVYYETSERQPSHSGEGDDVEYRHEQGINLAFADGHVKRYSKQDWPRPNSQAHFTFKRP